ncbi:AI-2E family transporter [Cellulomonas cellasea]|uniref:Putative PurR-regulated permease PerM n=1 Tax=Cellulomonas cellasea TaxID=43670 RepID=A0A7W4YCB1_9CELL|nr:AI-2E family transporter [Cellulomonas cellasea]MBB2923919.1 putative PurR-regulated permease PerM [Cellulomonas cellasea]
MTTTHPSTPTPVPTTKAPADRDGAGAPHARPTQPEARAAVPMSVQAAAAWSWRIIMIAAALALLLWVIGYFKVLVVSVAIAVLLTVLLAPFVRFLQRRARFSRGIASGTAVLGLLALVSGLLTLAGRSIVNGFAELSDQAQEGFRELARWLSAGPLDLSTDQIDRYIDQAQAQVSDNASSLVSGALSVGTTVGHVVAGALITLFCTFFFLLDGRQVWAWFVGLMPVSSRDRIHQAGRRGLVTLGGYTRTQILVALVDATGIGLGALILQVPLALPLATLVFLGSFIPIVGALVSGSVAVLVALVAHGPVVALIMVGVVLLVQQIEGHVLQPLLMGHAVSLHPVAVLLAVAAGSLAAGIVGALFAVPIVAVINTVVLYLHGHDKFPGLGDDDHAIVRGEPTAPDEPDDASVAAPTDVDGAGPATDRLTGQA